MGAPVGFKHVVPVRSAIQVSVQHYPLCLPQGALYSSSPSLSSHPYKHSSYCFALKSASFGVRRGCFSPSPRRIVRESSSSSKSPSLRTGNLCYACSLSNASVPAQSVNSIPQYSSSTGTDVPLAHSSLSSPAVSLPSHFTTASGDTNLNFADVSEESMPTAVSLPADFTISSGDTQMECGDASEGSKPSAVPLPVQFSTSSGDAGMEVGDVSEGLNFPRVKDSLNSLETLADQANLLDPDLQGILMNISDMQRQNEMLSERMRDIQDLLGRTTRSLTVKAQEAKIEAAKLKKLARLHHIEEIRRAEDVRRRVLEARIQLERKDNITNGMLDLGGGSLEVVPMNQMDKSTDRDGVSLRQDDIEPTSEERDGSRDQMPSTLVVVSSADVVGLPDTTIAAVENTKAHLGSASEQASDGTLVNGEGDSVLRPNLFTSESLECVVAHPGALSCTKTLITSDPSTKSAVVVLETTVKCAGDACLVASLNEDDYVALAVQTLADSAEELKRSRIQRATDHDVVQQEKHAKILDVLTNGRVVKAKPMEPPSKFGHESFNVQLLNEQTGERIDAMFKPGIEGNADGWHRAPIEMVAYKLNRLLGMDYVPPVVYKSGGLDVNYKHYNDGAFVYYVPNSQLLRKVPAASWGVSVALFLSDTRILDVLLNNSDRHHGHFLFGEHWVDGKMRPVLIDHAAGFRQDAVVKMEHENAFQTGAVRRVSAKTYLRLRFLEKQAVTSSFQSILSDEEVNKLMERRDAILAYLDSLVQERGYHRTVIEF